MKLAIFGLGSIGQRHVKNLLEMGETDLLGCDVRIGQEDFTPDLPIQMTDTASMVWDWKPEAVLVCAPPAGHFAIANDAIQAGAHCFIEKPMATTVGECEHLNFQAKENGVQLAVGYQLPFNPMPFTRWIGTVTLCVTHAQDMSQWPSQYQKNVLDEFSHELALSCYVHGPVKELVAYERQGGLRWTIELKHFHACSSVELYAGPGEYLRMASMDDRTTGWSFNKVDNDRAYKDELCAFLDACQGKGWNDRLCSGAEAAHVVRTIEACRKSAREFKVVTL